MLFQPMYHRKNNRKKWVWHPFCIKIGSVKLGFSKINDWTAGYICFSRSPSHSLPFKQNGHIIFSFNIHNPKHNVYSVWIESYKQTTFWLFDHVLKTYSSVKIIIFCKTDYFEFHPVPNYNINYIFDAIIAMQLFRLII